MKENKTKPDIRFKGFTEAWEQRKLGDICSEIGDGLHSAPTYDNNGEYYFINGNNLVNGHIEIDELETKRVSSYTFASNDKCLDEKTVLLSINGTIGNLAYYAGEKVMLGKSAAYLKVKDIKKEFLYTSLQTEMILNNFMLSLTGTTIKNLGLEAIKKTSILIPGYDEQTKISKHFNDLDNLITLHQRECDQLKELKKSMLKKMFPRDESSIPEVRFAGFTDAWEQRKLGEIVGIYDGVHQTPKYQDSGIMFLSVENISTLQSTKYISEEDFKRDYKVYPQENDILMTRIGDVGTTNVVTDNTLKAYYVSLALLKYKNTNPYFLSNAMQSNYVQKGLANRTLKTAVPMKINKDEIGKVDVILTAAVEEQSKIGSYFKNLDNFITLHQRELEILKNLKKTCLKRMFI